MKITPGKLKGLKAVADGKGVIAAAAMDQRGSLQKSLGKERGGEISNAMMEEFKILVSEVLTAARERDPPRSGMGSAGGEEASEECGTPARVREDRVRQDGPRPPAGSARRLVGAPVEGSGRRLREDSVVLHAVRNPKAVNDKKHAWVERIGDECRANDIPFFLEFVGYEEGADEKALEYAKKKPEIVTGSMAEFSKDRYGVDVLKVEVPVNMKFVEGAKAFGGQKAYTHAEAKAWFLKAATAATKPFIYLSAGVGNDEFTESLALAGESGVRYAGVLCGRATWKDGMAVYGKEGAAAFRRWLEHTGVDNINKVNAALKTASPWFSFYGVKVGRRAGVRSRG